MDMNSAVGRNEGVSMEQLARVATFRTSEAFSERDKAALVFTEEMTRTPVDVPAAVFEQLQGFFSDREIVELTAMIAYENYRARFAHALDLPSDGLCELPTRRPVTDEAAAEADPEVRPRP